MTKKEILVMEAGQLLSEVTCKSVGINVEWIEGAYRYPPVSTNISAAWQVVEKMFELGHSMSLLHLSSESYPDYWYCDFRLKGKTAPPEYEWVDHISKAPEAICKAALLAKLEKE